MALANCVVSLLCGLSAGVIATLNGIIKSYIALIDVEIAAASAYLVYLDILTAPVRIAKNFVDLAVNEVRAGANIIPFDLIGQCTDIGSLNVAISDTLDAVLIDANIISNDLERQLSFRDEVAAALADLQALRSFYTQVTLTLSVCGAAT